VILPFPVIVIQLHPSGSFPHWGDVSTWFYAMVALAALIAAILAYGKQSAQLVLQRAALIDQQQANSNQANLVNNQLAELAGRAAALERQQAEAVTVLTRGWGGKVPGVRSTGRLHMAVVSNESPRPIRNVACRIQQTPKDGMSLAPVAGRMGTRPPTQDEADISRITTGQPAELIEELMDVTKDSKVRFVRASGQAGFIFPYSVASHPDARITVRFADDAGLNWQIDPDLRLTRLDSRDDW
jgi:hypothetical protein